MPEIVACLAAFNEADHIARTLRSVKAYCDRVVIIDSAYVTNPIEATHSTDQTRAIAEAVCAAWPARPLTYIESPEKLVEAVARNAYLGAVHSPDWALVIDGDEVLLGDHAEIVRLFDAIRAGEVRGGVDVSVFTTAVNVNKMAGDVTEDEFLLHPLIATWGRMPRLFPVSAGLAYLPPAEGFYTPILTQDGRPFVSAQYVQPEALLIVNDHAGRSYAGYRAAYEWESA